MGNHVPRLHVLLARAAPTAVVVRRGPSRRTALIGWDRLTDTFSVGQWLHGRIYERRSDLSPDGRHFLYFAMNGHWESLTRGSWTAIARAPYLKAVTLLGKGDCWHGGGLFLSDATYWLNDDTGHRVLHQCPALRRVDAFPWHESYGGECPGVYFIRLQRDGWTLRDTVKQGKHGTITTFEKCVDEEWVLRKLAHAGPARREGRGCYHDTHELINISTGLAIVQDDWEWADVDRDRLVWAEAGRLLAGRLTGEGVQEVRTLQDFTTMTFTAIKAPY